jgi:hypothetical protein
MISNTKKTSTMAGKKKLLRFSEFVAKSNGNDRALAEDTEVISAGITQAIFTIIPGDKPYQERKAITDRVCANCLSFSEGGGQVVVMVMAMH